jgi:hypothetical protein
VTVAPMSTARFQPTATLLADGRVLVAGGLDGVAALSSAEIYDPDSNAWSSAGDMGAPHFHHVAVALPENRVLLAGGLDAQAPSARADIATIPTATRVEPGCSCAIEASRDRETGAAFAALIAITCVARRAKSGREDLSARLTLEEREV